MIERPTASARLVPADDAPKPQLVRVIGRWTLTALVLNCIIASGIFKLPADVARVVGPWAPLAYVLGAMGIATIMISFAEVSSQFREAGGPYLYARQAFGVFAGIQTAWFAWLARVAAAAAIADVLAGSLEDFRSGISAPIPRAIVLIGLIGVLTVVNLRGVRGGTRVNNAMTIAKLLPLALFVVVGLFLAPRGESTVAAPLPATSDWLRALVVLLFAYGGFEVSVMAAGETKNPRGDAPFALLMGLALVTMIYVSAHYVAMRALPDLANSKRPLADAARVFAGTPGVMVIAVGTVLSTLGALCGNIVAAPRMLFALGERGDFPRWFGVVHPEYRTPYVAILFWSVMVLGLALSGEFLTLAVLSVAARLISYGMTCAALVKLRRSQPEADAWRAPAGTLIALLGVAFCSVMVTRVEPQHALMLGAVASIATLNWFAVRKKPATAK